MKLPLLSGNFYCLELVNELIEEGASEKQFREWLLRSIEIVYGRIEFYRLCEDCMPFGQGWQRYGASASCEVYS